MIGCRRRDGTASVSGCTRATCVPGSQKDRQFMALSNHREDCHGTGGVWASGAAAYRAADIMASCTGGWLTQLWSKPCSLTRGKNQGADPARNSGAEEGRVEPGEDTLPCVFLCGRCHPLLFHTGWLSSWQTSLFTGVLMPNSL